MARVARLGVVIDSAGAKKGADETKDALAGIDKAAERAADTLKKASLAIGGLVSVGAVIKKVVDESITAQNAQAQLEAAVASTGGAAGRTVAQMQALASELQGISVYGDDAIQTAQALLLTFREIKGDVFDDATRALVDMAARMGGDVSGAAMQLGKALNDPTQGMTALSKAGITFSDEQKRVVAAMQKTGDMAGAQRVILDELKSEFGTSAAKARDTLGGALAALGNAFGDLLEVSRASSGGVVAALELITRNVGLVVAAAGALATVFAARVFAGWIESARAFAAAQTALAGATTLAARASMGLAAALNLVGGVPGLVVIGTVGAIAKVMGAFATAAEKAKAAAEKLTSEYTALSPAAVAAAIATERLGLAQIQAEQVMTGAAFDAKQKAIAGAKERIAALEAVAVAQERTAKAAQADGLDTFAKKIADARAELEAFKEGGKLAAEAFKLANAEWSDASTKNRTLQEALKDGDAAALKLLASARELATVQAASASAADQQKKSVKDLTKAFQEQDELFRKIEGSTRSLLDEKLDALNATLTAQSAANIATSASIDKRKQENAQIREQIAALLVSEKAYRAVLLAQEQAAAVAEEQARQPGGTLSAGRVKEIKDAVAESVRLKEALGAALGLLDPGTASGQSADTLADTIGRATPLAQGLAGAFGEVGRSIASAVGAASQLVQELIRAQIARKAVDKANASGDTAGAAKATGASNAAAFGVVGATIAVFAGVNAMISAQRAKAEEESRKMAELFQQYADAVGRFARSLADAATGEFAAAKNKLAGEIGELYRLAAASSGVVVAAGTRQTEASLRAAAATIQYAAGLGSLYYQLLNLADQAAAAEAALKKEQEAKLATLNEDLEIRRLVAAGATEEAAARRMMLEQQREYARIEKDIAGAEGSVEYLRALREVQQAELDAAAAARELARTRRATEFGADMTAREQTLAGNDRGAFITRQGIGSAKALAEAEDLVKAGTITAEMFERFKVLIGSEMADALKAFDAAVAAALQAQQDDLAVRTLVAQGNEAGAAQLRREIANRKELEGVTDAALRTQILYVQGLEAIAIAQAEAAAEAQRLADIDASIDQRMIAIYKTLDPAKAKELETKRREIDRATELAAANDATTEARLRELYALEDQAAALAEVAAAMETAAAAAKSLSDFSDDLNDQWLRATGRTFDANVAGLNKWRDEQLKKAAQNGLANDPDTQRKIQETYDANYQKLIAGTMQSTADAAASAAVAEAELITRSVSRSISSEEAVRLLDVATSQLVVLRQIATNTEDGGGSGGVRISVTVQGGAYSGTPAEVGRGIAESLAPLVDDALGRRVGVARRLTGADAL